MRENKDIRDYFSLPFGKLRSDLKRKGPIVNAARGYGKIGLKLHKSVSGYLVFLHAHQESVLDEIESSIPFGYNWNFTNIKVEKK